MAMVNAQAMALEQFDHFKVWCNNLEYHHGIFGGQEQTPEMPLTEIPPFPEEASGDGTAGCSMAVRHMGGY